MGQIVIVEDNKITRDGLVSIVKEIEPNCSVFATGYAREALEYAKKNEVNAFFLDIQLLDYTGLELAKELRAIDKFMFTPIVFITAIPSREMEAFRQIHCYDYIIKPFTKEIVRNYIYNVVKHCSSEPKETYITICRKGYVVRLKTTEILYIEYKNRKVYLVTPKEQIASNNTLKDTLGELDHNFIQVHQAYIVNKKHVKEINLVKSYVSIYNSDILIPIGRTYKAMIGEELQ